MTARGGCRPGDGPPVDGVAAAVGGGGGGRLPLPDADEVEETGDMGAPSGQEDDLL